MSDLKDKLLKDYRSLQESRLTSLRKFLIFIGQNPYKMSRKQLDDISKSERYRSWLIDQNTGKTQKYNEIEERVLNLNPKQKIKVVLDTGDTHHINKIHPSHTVQQKRIKNEILNVTNKSAIDIHHSPGHLISRGMGKRGYMATGKGKVVLQKFLGKRHKTFYKDDIDFCEAENDQYSYQEMPNNKNVAQKVLDKSKKLKSIDKGSIIVNPTMPEISDTKEK